MSAAFFNSLSKNAVYTGMRTTAGHTKIFQLQNHLERLAKQPLVTVEDQGGAQAALDVAAVQQLVMPRVLENVTSFERLHPECAQRELKIVVALDSSMQVSVEVSELPQVDLSPVQVELVVHAREQAALKTVQWEQQRHQFLEAKKPESNEVLLLDDDHQIYEGLSSNFFVLHKNGRVQIAPEPLVLLGTTMAMLLEMWKTKGRQVEESPPLLGESSSWEACFVCSTSRLVRPVSSLLWLGGDLVRTFQSSALTQQLVQEALEENLRYGVPFRE